MLILALAALSACQPDVQVDQARMADALPVLLVPPAAQVVGRSGSEDALQITFRSQWDKDRLAEYYRELLSKEPWTLVNDAEDRDGALVLYAERDGPPLWIRIDKAVGAAGSMVEISGAVAGPAVVPDSMSLDSTAADSTPS
ncbi:MAG: hypothetical protein HKM89_02150 [Gemmatimonadales bacterium]|nr:hypothetical protein [Gemmatimonadales bacterium]